MVAGAPEPEMAQMVQFARVNHVPKAESTIRRILCLAGDQGVRGGEESQVHSTLDSRRPQQGACPP